MSLLTFHNLTGMTDMSYKQTRKYFALKCTPIQSISANTFTYTYTY